MRPWQDINGMLNNERDVFILGSGPSLKGFDFRKLDNEFTIAVNHTIEVYPEATCLLFGDKVFPNKTSFDFSKYNGMIFASDHCKSAPQLQPVYDKVYFYEKRKDEPTTTFKRGLFHPTSSGLQALNLALIMKARRIFLMGFDYHHSGGMHFYGDVHKHHLAYPEEKTMKKVRKFKYFEKYKNKIINLSPSSLIEEFEKREIGEVIH